MAQTVKCLTTMQETHVRSPSWEDPMEKEMASHSRNLAWKIPCMEEHGRLQSMGSQRVGHDWATSLSLSSIIIFVSCLSGNHCPSLLGISVLTTVSSVQFSHSVVSDSLWPYELQHARPPCPSPYPGVHIHQVRDAIQPSHPLSSPSTPAANPSQHQGFQMSQLFTSGGQSIGASASTSVLPMNTQDWSIFFRMDWLDLPAVVSCILFDSFCFIEKVNMVFLLPLARSRS